MVVGVVFGVVNVGVIGVEVGWVVGVVVGRVIGVIVDRVVSVIVDTVWWWARWLIDRMVSGMCGYLFG